MPILHTSIIFPNVANDDETLFFKIIFLKYYFRNFIQLRKKRALFFNLDSRISPIFMIYYLKIWMTVILH